ncbi:MAG: phytanoyl-CoA dioxygenase family protein [Pirellulaceae bacterium]|nr:phytanoyl-CoA dioxygenase family protein [Pirellulaceae bacterium]
MSNLLSSNQVGQFERDSFLIIEDFLDDEETALLQQSARADEVLMLNAHNVKDASGKNSKLALWDHPGDDIYGLIARSHRVVDRIEQLLGAEVYHYHSTMMLKEPRIGGAWEWHQDYGYWYHYGCLFPDILAVMIAIDAQTKENGCLQVIRGSHRLGRLDHVLQTESGTTQPSIDPARIEAILDRMELVYCEMPPGAAIFFHGNILHRSDANLSDHSRWALRCVYNAVHNDPYADVKHARYTPLEKVPDEAIKNATVRGSDPQKGYLSEEGLRDTRPK